MTERTLADIEEELYEANSVFQDARECEDDARRRATDALNRVNQLQKEFSAKVNEIQSAAAPETDWKRPPTRSYVSAQFDD